MSLTGSKMKGADILIQAAFTAPAGEDISTAEISFMAFVAVGPSLQRSPLCEYSTSSAGLIKSLVSAGRVEVEGKIPGHLTEKIPGNCNKVSWYFRVEVEGMTYLHSSYAGSFLLYSPAPITVM